MATLLKAGRMALKRMGVPLYGSKYSKRTYTIHQHLLMLAVKELEKETYRGLIDRLEDSKAVDEHLGLERVPHFTTPHKFLQRTPRVWFHLLMKRLVGLLTQDLYVTLDASHFRQGPVSYRTVVRLGKEVKVRETFQSVAAREVVTGLFVASQGLPGVEGEGPWGERLLKRLDGVREAYGDTAFDDENLHEYLFSIDAEGYMEIRGEPARGFRRRAWAYAQAHPCRYWHKRWKRNHSEGGWRMVKAQTGEVVWGEDDAMRDRYHLVKLFAVDLYVVATRHAERTLSFVFGRISAERW